MSLPRCSVLRSPCAAALLIPLLSWALPATLGAAEILHLGVDDITLEIPEGWSFAKYSNFHKIYSVPVEEQHALDAAFLKRIVQISVHTEQRLDHADALQRLRQIASQGAGATFVEIAGWPGLRRRMLGTRPQPGVDSGDTEQVWKVTTAVAIERVLLRLEAWLPPTAEELIATVEEIGASLTTSAVADPLRVRQEIQELRAQPRKGLPRLDLPKRDPDLSSDARTQEERVAEDLAPLKTLPAAGTTVRVTSQVGRDSEIEIAVADGAMDIVIGTNNGFFFSSDGGNTWSPSANLGGGPANDPSLSWGQSGGPQGTFYAANIATPSTGLWTSTNGGATFNGPTAIYTCGQGGDPPCAAAFPDQEHIVTDRLNVTAGGDQVYDVWRHLDGNWGIVCSADSGVTWSANGLFFAGDLPKVAVGQDGFVYVPYHAGGDDDILVHKFSSCEAGLNPVAGFPVVVMTDPGGVACPVPGLDRCNRRNSLASPTVAVDDTDASHVYIAYAANTNPGPLPLVWFQTCNDQNLCNEDIVVQDSLDGGVTWSGPIVISSGVTARRFMPWACTAGGEVHVAWYDRGAASPGGTIVSNNSLTDFYRAKAFRNLAGNLAKSIDMQINEVGSTDAQCEAGFPTGTTGSWPAGVDRQGDSESCSLQPQLGGVCCVPGEVNGGATGGFCTPTAASSQTRCDFSPDTCLGGEVCAVRRGSPKYGDYNGIACAEGRLFTTWASATSPASITPASADIDTFFTADVVCCVPQIQVPAAIDFDTVCVDETTTDTLEVCNTGVENLVVGSISSDTPEFAVTEPLAGFPVTISPDFCFPFEVTFDPSAGPQAGVLTVNNNDPVNPAFEVPVSGDVGEGDLQVAIADSGDFGDVCAGEFADLNLTLFNQGACDLTIDSISVDNPQFVLPDDTTFPLVLSPDADFNLPIRFEPDACGDAPVLGELAIATDEHLFADGFESGDLSAWLAGKDAAQIQNKDAMVQLSGTSPCPDINVAIANSGDFGKVCKAEHADLDLTLFNQGKCDLNISDIELMPDPGSFELPDDLTLPLVLSPDADFTLPVRFAPEECIDAPEMRTLVITSDDPDESVVNVEVSGESPCPSLVIDPPELAGLSAFPPTVVDTTGTLGCFSERSLNLRNNGGCPLTVEGVSAAGADFTVTDPSVFPLLLPAGEETLSVTVRFAPQADADPLAPSEVTGTLTVVSDDPGSPHEAGLCGESAAQSGVRILVTDISSGTPVPIDEVDVITITSKGIHEPGPINLRYTDQPLVSAMVCGNDVLYHVDQETLPSTDTTGSNPNSSYEAKAKEGNLQTSERFGLGQCELREFQLQLGDSDSETCLLLPKGAPCTTDGECCSGNCSGPAGGKTCK